ncbi:MAG: hypothetical protein U1E38_08675 [Rhodospirillales bacterium]
MAVAADWLVQGLQMLLVLAIALLLTGFVRWLKARMLRRRGPSLLQPYRDLARLVRRKWSWRRAPRGCSGSLPIWCLPPSGSLHR